MDVWLGVIIHVSNIEYGPEILKTLRAVGISDIEQAYTDIYITSTHSKFMSFVKMYHKNHDRYDFTCTVAYDIHNIGDESNALFNIQFED